MAVDDCNEITVKIKGDINEFYENVKKKGFKVVDKFLMDDTFFIPVNLDLNKMTTREILSNAVIVRIVDRSPEKIVKNITFKKKIFDDAGNILSQSKVECDVENPEDAKKLLNAIGYKEIMRIKESDVAFGKDGFEFAVKDIENGEKLIESEPSKENPEFDNIEKLKVMFEKYSIPIYTDNYFVKKAEIELDKILKR